MKTKRSPLFLDFERRKKCIYVWWLFFCYVIFPIFFHPFVWKLNCSNIFIKVIYLKLVFKLFYFENNERKRLDIQKFFRVRITYLKFTYISLERIKLTYEKKLESIRSKLGQNREFSNFGIRRLSQLLFHKTFSFQFSLETLMKSKQNIFLYCNMVKTFWKSILHNFW